MSDKVPKALKNPELQDKFQIGDIVDIPRRIAYTHTSKLAVLRKPILGRVISLGPRMVGKHFRWAVDISCSFARMEVWEEWQMEGIHKATPDQLNRFGEELPDYLSGDSRHQSTEISPANAGALGASS